MAVDDSSTLASAEAEIGADGGVEARRSPRRWWRHELARFLELVGLSGLLFAQPLFDRYGSSPELLLLKRVTFNTALELGIFIIVVPPLAVWLLTFSARMIGSGAERRAHNTALGVLGGLWVTMLAASLPPPVRVVAGLMTGAVLIWAVYRFRVARQWLRWLSLAPILFLLLFLFASDSSEAIADSSGMARAIADVPIGNPRPVVLLIFDELPTASLLDDTGNVDDEAFPNFARLAEGSTWFRNTSTVAPTTPAAVTALLTGQYPQDGVPAIASRYPVSLFTLLGVDYDVHGHEAMTRLCPTEMCATGIEDAGLADLLGAAVIDWTEQVTASRSPVSAADLGEGDNGVAVDSGASFDVWTLHDPGPLEEFGEELQSWKGGADLFIKHLLFPHTPFEFTGSAHRYPDPFDGAFGEGLVGSVWPDSHSARLGNLRHLEQLRYTDRWLGTYIDAMQDSGLWDDAVIVVAADHGAAFMSQEPNRGITETNAWQGAWIPFFVRAPDVDAGVIDDRDVTAVDVVPTILDLLGIPPSASADGVSALLATPPSQPTRFMLDNVYSGLDSDESGYGKLDGSANFERLLDASPPGWGSDDLRWWRWGVNGDLVGLAAADVSVGTADGVSAQLSEINPDEIEADEVWVDALLLGSTDWQGDVAIALNGTIVAISTVQAAGEFHCFLPADRLQPGANTIEVYAIEGAGASARLSLIPWADG